MVQPSLVYSILAVLPPAAAFFLAYGRYDGTFRDNVVFLHFIGGVLMGFLLGFATAFAVSTLTAGVPIVLLMALLYPVSIVVAVNRRRWQGERHAVFNGGAFGLGAALMLGFTLLYVLFQDAVTLERVGLALALSGGLAGLFLGLGLLAGDGVRRRRPFRVAFLGTAILIAPTVFLVEFVATRAWLWVVLLLAYGVVFAVAAERRLLVEGLDPDQRRQRRRARRKAA